MTPKERLARIKTVIKDGGVYRDYTDSTQAFNNDVDGVEQSLTELDRLQKFKATFDAYELSKKQDFIAYENWQECEKELSEYKQDIQNLIKIVLGSTTIAELEEEMKTMDVLLKAFTPPTSDEVCEKLSEYIKRPIEYYAPTKQFVIRCSNGYHEIVRLHGNNEISFDVTYCLPPHLITLIGRFYEGIEKK